MQQFASRRNELNALNAELESLVVKYDKEINTENEFYHEVDTNWESVNVQLNALNSKMTYTSELANTITLQVRNIDAKKQCVKKYTRQVNGILQMEKCKQGMLQCLREESQIQALELLKVYLNTLDGEMDGEVQEMANELERSIKSEIQRNMKKDSIGMVKKFGPYLNLFKMDMWCVTEMVKVVCEEFGEKWKKDSVKSAEELSRVLNDAAEVMQKMKKCFCEYFHDVGGYGILMVEMHGACEGVVIPALKGYLNSAAMVEWTKQVQEVALEDEQMNGLDTMVDDVVTWIQYTETYDRFVTSNWRLCEEKMKNSMNLSNGLNMAVKDVVGVYCSLENQFLTSTIAKSLKWEEYQMESCTSTLVEEVYFICRNVGERSLATGHLEAIAAIFQMLNRSISLTLLPLLENRSSRDLLGTKFPQQLLILLPGEDKAVLDGAWGNSTSVQRQVKQLAKLGKNVQENIKSSVKVGMGQNTNIDTRTPSRSNSINDNKHQRMMEWKSLLTVDAPSITLNNLYRCIAFSVQMTMHFKHTLPSIFPTTDDTKEYTPPKRLQNCLDMFADTQTEMETICQKGIQNLCTILRSRIEQFLTSTLFNDTDDGVFYDLDAAEFEYNRANDPFAQVFILRLDHMLEGLESTLIPTCYLEILKNIAEIVAECFINGISTKSFTALGSLQLDHDLRVILSYFTDKSSSIDYKASFTPSAFSVLCQVNAILNIDELSDVKDIYAKPIKGIPWTLSQDDVRTWLSLRIDFQESEIQQLVL